jgi:DNA-binding transcriptional LysR family regulator
MINLKQLHYFKVLAEELHFRRAAEKLNITQSPLSVAIQQMEAGFGISLFERNQRSVKLTEAGQRLYDHAVSILGRVEECDRDMTSIGRGQAGRLRIGFTAATSLLSSFPTLISEYRAKYPSIDIILRDRTSLQQLAEIESRELDVGVIRRPKSDIPLTIAVRKLTTDRLVVAMSSSHALAARADVNIADLQQESFVFFPRAVGVGIYDQFIDLCAQQGYFPNVVQEAREATTIIGLVAAGIGISVVPAGMRFITIPNIIFKDISNADAETDLLLAYRAGEENPRIAHLIHLAQYAFRPKDRGPDT